MPRTVLMRCVAGLFFTAAVALTGPATAQDGLMMSDSEPAPEAAPLSEPVAADANVPGTLVAVNENRVKGVRKLMEQKSSLDDEEFQAQPHLS